MSRDIVRGLPSTHGDHYQLNTTTIVRHAARTFPEQEIVYRTVDGGWGRYTYAAAYARIQRSANALRSIGVGPADMVGILDWNSKRHFELYWAIPGLGAVMLQMNLRLWRPRTWCTSPVTATQRWSWSTNRCFRWPRRWHRMRRT